MSKTNEREIAADILTSVTDGSHYIDIELRNALNKHISLTHQQKAFITEAVKGVVRNMLLLDYLIDCRSNTPTVKMKPVILNILRLTVYQILFMDGVPDFAACSEGVELARAKGYSGLTKFVNGVVRSIIRSMPPLPDADGDAARYLSIKYSFPLWMIEQWLTEYAYKAVENICMLSNTSPDVTIAVNMLKTSKISLMSYLEQEGMLVTEGGIVEQSLHISNTDDMTKSSAFLDGLFHVMDESSALAVHILDPAPGDTVVDVCAAPGGKSLYAAYLMNNMGTIHSWDIHEHKLKLIERSAERLGIGIISARQADAAQVYDGFIQKADKVLVDAPCSGLGLVRKKPDIKYQKSLDDIKSLAQLQRDILHASSEYVRPGGDLVYSTCTVTQAENDENVCWFTDNHPFELTDISRYLPNTPGYTMASSRTGTVQLLPGARNDGFYIARFRRI